VIGLALTVAVGKVRGMTVSHLRASIKVPVTQRRAI
jgi:hypothetical protein